MAYFAPTKENGPTPLGSFDYCEDCRRFDDGKNRVGGPIIVWNAGIEQKGTSRYLWFGHIVAIEKQDNRRTLGGVWRGEDYYPNVTISLQKGKDGSDPPQSGSTSVTFQDDETRDAFYDGATAALEAWRARFPEAFTPVYVPSMQNSPQSAAEEGVAASSKEMVNKEENPPSTGQPEQSQTQSPQPQSYYPPNPTASVTPNKRIEPITSLAASRVVFLTIFY